MFLFGISPCPSQIQAGRSKIPSPSGGGLGWGWRLPVLTLLAALALAVLIAGTASANGSVRLVVIDEVAGPYQLRVGILPADPIAGPLHVSIRILHDADETAVEDATVRVSVVGAGTPGETNAVNSPQNPELYEGNLWLDALGDWQVTLNIDSPAGPATHAFNVRAREEGGFNLMFVIVAVAAVLVVATLFWSQLQRRRRITRGRR